MPRSVAEILPFIPPATSSQTGLATAAQITTLDALDTDNAGAFNFGSIDLSRNTQYTPEPYVQLGTMDFELSGVTPVTGCGFVLLITGNGAAITYSSDFVAADGSSLTVAPYSGFTDDMMVAVDWHGGLGKARVYMEGAGVGGGTMTAAEILAALQSLGSPTPGLDADLLDGQHATAFIGTARQVATTHSLTGGGDLSANRTLSLVNDAATPGANQVYGTSGAGTKGWKADPGGTMTAAEILAALITVDGAASGLDADLLDGQQASALLARANHTGTQLLSTISNAGTAAAAATGDFATAAQGAAADTALQNLAADTTPELGGALDGNGFAIFDYIQPHVASVTGTLNQAAHGGRAVHITGNVVVPVTSGFMCEIRNKAATTRTITPTSGSLIHNGVLLTAGASVSLPQYRVVVVKSDGTDVWVYGAVA